MFNKIRNAGLLFLIILILISCSGNISSIDPTNVELSNPQKVLLLPVEPIQKDIFKNKELYNELNKVLDDEFKKWLEKINVIDVISISDVTDDFDYDEAYISYSGVNDKLMKIASENNCGSILYPIYNIETTIASTESKKIYEITLDVMNYYMEAEGSTYHEKFKTVIGVDLSLFEGKKTIISEESDTSESDTNNSIDDFDGLFNDLDKNNIDENDTIEKENNSEVEDNIKNRVKNGFFDLIYYAGNDYTIHLKNIEENGYEEYLDTVSEDKEPQEIDTNNDDSSDDLDDLFGDIADDE